MPKAGIKYGPRIKGPDYDEIAEAAEKQVLKGLGLEKFERPEDMVAFKVPADDLVVKAAEILQQADGEFALYVDERNQALAHLWFYEHRIGLAKTAGLTNIGYRQILAKALLGDKRGALPNLSNEELVKAAAAAGVQRVESAEAKLLETAPIVFAARTRRDIAVRYMQEAVLALSLPPYEWSPEKTAEHAGVHRDLIYKQRRTARQRHGL